MTRSSLQSPRSMRSLSRPGVATTTSAPPRSALACRPMDMPPTTVASRSFSDRAYGVSASVTCWASSRVGTSTRASGRLASARRPSVRASSARPNARVLPEPVRPRPRTSRPASEFGRVAAWIGNGTVTPSVASAALSLAGISSSPKVSAAGSAGVTVTGRANSPFGAELRRPAPPPERPAPLPERRGPPPNPAARRSPPPEYPGAPPLRPPEDGEPERVRANRSFERGVRSRFMQNLSSMGHVSRDSFSGEETVNGTQNRKNEPMK